MSEERKASSYYFVRDEHLVAIRPQLDAPDPLAVFIHGQFRGMILSAAFPCLGGLGAVRRGDYSFGVDGALGSTDAIRLCGTDLDRFVGEWPAESHPVAVFVAAFHGPIIPTEEAFETALWEQLRGLRGIDAESRIVGQLSSTTGDPSHGDLSRAVADQDPGFIYRGRDFFVVGLHPAASRWARRFGWPTLVFNALTHSDELRAAGKYERMQNAILTRDRRLQGSDNPSLPFSQVSQFSGRCVRSDWRCPVDFD